MKRFNIKTRILLGYITPLCLFIVLGGVVYSSAVAREKLQQEVAQRHNTIVKMNQLMLALSRIIRNTRGQVLFPQDSSYRQSYEKGLKAFEQLTPELRQLITEPAQKQRLNTLLAAANKDAESASRVFDLLKGGDNNQVIAQLSQLWVFDFDRLHEEILKQEMTALAEVAKQEKAAHNFLIIVIVVGSILSALITILTGLLLSGEIIKTINKATSAIAISSTQIVTTIEQQERIASQQAASVHETTTTMDELEASCRQSAEQAKAAVGAAQEALQLAEAGTQAVKETLSGMFTLEKKVEAIAEQILHLSEQASQIGSISQIVSDLANQTNMLALNSSVEAVRAGEHGKGFAVVANEIRRLSDQSQKSADKINNLVLEIQSAISSTVMVTEEGTKTVKTGLQVTQKTDQAFSGVAEAVNHMVLNNQQISLNLKQQLDAIQQVVQAMDIINKGAKETATGISQTRVGTEQLNTATVALKEIV